MVHRTLSAVCGALWLVLMAGHAIAADGPQPTAAELKKTFERPSQTPFPEDNPYTSEKAKLGKILFFDPSFSGSGTRSCATCHNPGLSWGDGLPRAIGEARAPLPLRSPTTLNLAWGEIFGWDGKFPDLESVTFAPIVGNANMNRNEADLISDLSANAGYRALFAAAFPGADAITRRQIEQAIATYERTIVSAEAPFDRWINGDENSIDDAAKHGFALFTGKADCAACHSGWNFTDSAFHDIGTGAETEPGRGRLFPTSVALRHAFKTPTLRDVAHRAPFMHDGTIADLPAVIEHYDGGGVARPSRDSHIHPLSLTGAEKAALLAFLQTLTAEDPPTTVPRLPR